MATPPQFSPEQRAAALAKASEARTARAEIKIRLKMGSLTLHEALAEAATNDNIAKLKVLSLLESLPGLGKVKARRLMAELEIADNRRVQGLGVQQKQALLAKF